MTPHAVRRYLRRVEPGLSYDEALGALIHEAERARRVKGRHGSVALYRGAKPLRLRFFVDESAEPLPALVTVLAGCDAARGARR